MNGFELWVSLAAAALIGFIFGRIGLQIRRTEDRARVQARLDALRDADYHIAGRE